MDKDFDLRPYLSAVIKRWRLIIACGVSFALITALTVWFSPQPSRARADLFISPRSPELTFDGRFTDGSTAILSNQSYQRQALIDLGKSRALEARAAERLGRADDPPGRLAERITIRSDSDLINVLAVAPTQAEASALAEAWAQGYQELVAELYNGAADQRVQVELDLADAQQRFDQSQNALDSFYAGGELIRATYEVTRLTGLVLGGAGAQVGMYTSHLSRTQELGLILEDARSLQAQYEGGGQTDLSAALAALAVRARLAGSGQLPVQLSFTSTESFAQGEAATADLARFVAVLEAEYERMVAAAGALAGDLAAGDTSAVGLAPETSLAYESELAKAKAALARAEGVEQRLLQDRRLALSTIEVLQNRSNELQIQQSLVPVELRVVSVAPERPGSLLVALLLNTAVAAVAGVLLGVILALALELARRLRGAARQGDGPPPAGEAIGRLPSSD